jgi:two-component system, NtrC family, sensor histidine kinase HydH
VRQLLQNPVLLKMVIGLVVVFALFLVGLILMKVARKEITKTESFGSARISAENPGFSLAAYEGVIRKLKDQEKELERLRKSERDRASESASLSEAVLSNLGSGVVLFNTMSLVRQANPAAKLLMGYASPFGLHARDIFRGVAAVRIPENQAFPEADQPNDGGALIRMIELCARQGHSFRRIEADYKTPDGQSRVLGITVSPVRSAKDEAVGAACLISDLTEITHLSQQMRLRENLAALGEMSAGIAHEFKNALATISGYAQMLEHESARDPQSAEFGAKIASETTSLSRIVTDFLNFAKPQGLQREPIDVRPVLEDCAQEAGLRLEFVSFPDATVEGDPVALRQAFSNLLRNSAEATATNAVPVVKIEGTVSGTGLKFSLADNGSGIAPDQLNRIFIPFFTTKAAGTGLGLALVHRIITEHGGTVTVASEGEGKGATFTLTFPPAAMGRKA